MLTAEQRELWNAVMGVQRKRTDHWAAFPMPLSLVLAVGAHLEAIEQENARLKEALVEADWVIEKLRPHESMAILVRGFRPDATDIERGAKARQLIDAALAHPDEPNPSNSSNSCQEEKE